MQKVPQIVRERLKAAVSAGPHPEADLLTAFAERSLSDRERAGVLEHLAACGDCREIVALALPPTEAAVPSPVALRRPWITWPAFRWAFAAAGVVIVAVGIVQYQQRSQSRSQVAMVAREIAPPAVEAEKSQSAPSPAPPAPIAPKQQAEADLGLRASDKKSADQAQHQYVMKAVRPPASPVVSGGIIVGNQPNFGPKGPNLSQMQQQNQQIAARVQPAAPILTANQVGGSALRLPVPQSTGQAGSDDTRNERKAASAAPSAGASAQLFDNYTPAPVGKAKAASPQLPPGEPPIPRWGINASGGLQRSFDGGSTWQDVDVTASMSYGDSANHAVSMMVPAPSRQKIADNKVARKDASLLLFRAVTVNGPDVWAGGSNAVLYHSVDAGTHWIRVLPSSGGIALTGDVIAIQFADALRGSVTTSTGETWITADAGQTWLKQ